MARGPPADSETTMSFIRFSGGAQHLEHGTFQIILYNFGTRIEIICWITKLLLL